MTIPKAGQPVRGSKSGRPIMALLDLLGRRKTLRILWELFVASTPLKFRELEEAADTNPAVLNTRLKELRATGLVVHSVAGYALSEEGRSLLDLVMPLHQWSEHWAAKQATETECEDGS